MQALINIILFAVVNLLSVIFTFGILPALWIAAILTGRSSRAEKAKKKLHGMLMDGEALVSSSLQKWPYGLFKRRDLLAITDSRFIRVKRPYLGGFKMTDFQWKDLRDARLEENTLPDLAGSNISFYTIEKSHENLVAIGIDSSEASSMYSYSQKQEQAWEEKRRVRELEDKRAVSGGITLGGGGLSQPQTASAPAGGHLTGFAAKMADLKSMKDSGTINDAEFDEMKSKILSEFHNS